MEEGSGPNKLLVALIGAIIVIGILAGVLAFTLAGPGGPTEVEYTVGLAIATSGAAYATEGPLRRDAALLAVDQMNARLEASGSPVRFVSIHEDTEGTAEGARAALQSLAAAGVQVVVGPLSSGETSAIKSFVDENQIVAISPSSTALSLAVEDDYIFRVVPTDAAQAQALATLANNQGFTKIAIIHRQDDYGQGIADLFEEVFTTEYGGQVAKVAYDPAVTDPATEVGLLSQEVSDFGADAQTAVLVVAFDDDGTNIFDRARNDAVLPTVQWLGSESLRRPTFLPPDSPTEIADFLVDVGLMGFFPSPQENPVTVSFRQAYIDAYGTDPSPFSFFAYDAAMLGMLSILSAGTDDGSAVKGVLPFVAEKYLGASGYKMLNAAGDVAASDYRLWQVVSTNGDYEFDEIGTWSAATGELSLF